MVCLSVFEWSPHTDVHLDFLVCHFLRGGSSQLVSYCLLKLYENEVGASLNLTDKKEHSK